MSAPSGQEDYWISSNDNQYFSSAGFGQTDQQLDFGNYSDQSVSHNYSLGDDSQSANFISYSQDFLTPNRAYAGEIYTPEPLNQGPPTYTDGEDEPPLLEELGIDPDRILQKTLAVLNPFHRRGQTDDANYLLQDSDLAGPVAFWLLLAGCLVLAGSRAQFGYIYGLAATSCLLMYLLLSLMSNAGNITLMSVSSVLGYCILPVVALSGLGIFTSLRGTGGVILAVLTVFWASASASRLFCAMSGDEKQRLLIAYPCILLYGLFTLIVIQN